MDQFDSSSSNNRCVHTEANIHWRICNSGRLLALDPSTLEFSIVETPEDAQLCVASGEEKTELSDHCSIFPYLLCWPPAFLAALELEDALSASNNELPQGQFCCITEKKITFYFDSAASRHMSGDKKLIQNLRHVAKQDIVNIHTAGNKTICLNTAGNVKCGDINLSPVFYMKDLKHNIISVGQLDDGRNLIYLGENRVNVINTETGLVIGEGMRHHKGNHYTARNITSFRELTPGRKKMRAIQAGDVETGPSEMVVVEAVQAGDVEAQSEKVADVQLLETPTETDKKLLWILDCFCDHHMTRNKDFLCNTKPVKKTFITQGEEIEATEMGDVITDAVVLLNVLYCPKLRGNLISESQLDDEGYSCTRLRQRCKIQHRKSKTIVGTAYMDEEFVYRVNDFQPFDYLEDESVEPPLKRRKNTLKML